MRLADKVALVTGGASGIGREIARRYVEEGARVVLGDRNAALLRETARALGNACAAVEMDVTVEADAERATAEAVSRFGRLDIGVNSAGLGFGVPLTEQTEAQWDTVVDVCLKGVFLSMKHEARAMISGGHGGVIITIASINARQPAEGLSAYCAAKAGVEMLTRCAVVFLASDDASWISGDTLFVDGAELTKKYPELGSFRKR